MPARAGAPPAHRQAVRRDDEYAHGAVWEFTGVGQAPTLNQERFTFEHVKLSTRSYK